MAKDKSFFGKLMGSSDEPEEVEMNTNKGMEKIKMNKENGAAPAQGDEELEGQLTVDVYQTDDEVVIKSTIAGVKPEDVDVSINNDMITIRGERRKQEEISEDNYFFQECYWGAFSRSIVLPVEVEADQAKASIKDGVLTVRLPKSKKATAKNIPVMGE